VNAWEGLFFVHKEIDHEKICIDTLQRDLILNVSEVKKHREENQM